MFTNCEKGKKKEENVVVVAEDDDLSARKFQQKKYVAEQKNKVFFSFVSFLFCCLCGFVACLGACQI